jgi:two-component system, NtrC family, response regulator HydG
VSTAAIETSAKEALSLDCLVVDDDSTIRLCLEHMIRDAKHRVSSTSDGASALTLISEHRYDVVISDIRMPKLDGLTLFQHIHQVSPTTSVILMTAYATVPDAVSALKLGVYEYVGKPINSDEFRAHLDRIAEKRALELGLEQARAKLSGRDAGPYLIIGHSPPILRMLEMVDTLAPTDASILITGESGTGKELLARALQASSSRRSKPFVTINCAAFPESLLEAELFGYEKGAFTGAVGKRDGRFVAADGGTLLLDEIGEMPLPAQAKLLRVLQDGTFEPLGTNATRTVDIRILSATNRDLKKRIAEGRFREDLYYRLKVVEIPIPPLREHKSDLPLLFSYFARRNAQPGCSASGISPRAWALLAAYPFPGNIREFAHAIEHACLLAHGGEIDVGHLPPDVVGACSATNGGPPAVAAVRPLAIAADEFERECILRALNVTRGKRLKAAELLGISRRNLWLKLRKHGLSDSDLED